jgi:AcrR family transcriptional regulator
MVRNLNPEKREKFLNAALKLFVTNGVQNTSTAAIAQEAGTAAGTLFLYFPTKQALINELVLEIGRQHQAHMQSALAPSRSVQDTFITIWQASIGWFLENRNAYQFLQQVRNTNLVDEAVVQETGAFFTYYYEAIKNGHAQGILKPYPLEMIGELIYQDIVAVMNLLRYHDDPSQREEIIRQGFEIFWNGVKNAAVSHPLSAIS